MLNNFGKYLINFIVIMLFQVLILNQLNLGIYINPCLYILFILILPVETPGWLTLIIGFAVGLMMDAFLNTIGLHASATVFLSFLRYYLLRFFAPRDGYELGSLPVPSYFGFTWFFKYVSIATIGHHLFLFFMEVFTFNNFFLTIWKVILSSLFTITFILLAQLFGIRKEQTY